MRSSTVETRHGSGGTAMPGTGAFRLSPAFLPGLLRLARRAARITGLGLPFAERRASHAGMRIPAARAAAFAACLTLLLCAGSAQAQHERVDLSVTGSVCANCPVAPTAYAVSGPGVGEITLHWEEGTDERTTPVTMGSWLATWGTPEFQGLTSAIYSGAQASARSHVFTGLTPGQRYGIGLTLQDSESSNPTRASGILRAARFHVGDLSAADAPKIEVVRVVSAPTHDSDDDGQFDTYVRGDKILFDVEFSEPVEVTGEYSGVKLRIDLGADDTTLTNSRKVLRLGSVLNGGRTLRFAYTVTASDTDADGVWVQTAGSNQVLFLTGGATVKSAETGKDVSNEMAGLPTEGGKLEGAIRAKVDGSETGSEGPTPVSATVNGATLTVTFSENISWTTDGALIANLDVRNSGDVNGGNRNVNQHPMAVAHGDANTKLVLTLGIPAKAGDTVTLTHQFAGGTQALQDTSGNKAPAFRDLAVTNNTPGAASPPVPVRADVAGKSLRIVFDGVLINPPPGNRFTVHTSDNGLGARTIKGTSDHVDVGGSGDVDFILVTLAKAVRPDEQVRVSYAKPATEPILQGADMQAVQSFDRFRVETVHDVTPPTILQRTVVEETTTRYKVFVHFDEPLDESSVPPYGHPGIRLRLGVTEVPESVVTVAVQGRTVVLTVGQALPSGVHNVDYSTGATSPIRDLAGNPAVSLSRTFTRSLLQSGKPALVATDPVVAEGDRLTLTYTKALDPGSVPAASAFAFSDGFSSGIAGVEVVLDTVVPNDFPRVLLRLEQPVLPCTPAFTLSYTVPGTNPIQGLDGTDADALTNRAVTRKGVSATSLCVRRQASGSGGPSGNQRPVWEGKSVTLPIGKALNTAKTLDPDDFTVAANGASGSPAVRGASYTADGTGVVLTLGRSPAAGETATVGYGWPQSGQGLWDSGGNQIDSFEDVALRNAAPPPSLAVAGASAAEGETLAFAVTLDAASASAVTVDYATSGGTATADEDYKSASGTLTFAAGETEKTISVQALADTAAEDDETFTLTLSNAAGATLGEAGATGTIADAANALTASFHGLPDEHDGRKLFAFEIRFSEEFGGMRLTAVKRALAVTGGRLIDAKRTVRGQNRRVTVRVRPSQSGDVTLALVATSDCSAADAICASDGRTLSAVSATVPGPDSVTTAQAKVLPVLSVADARADEGASLAFSVTLDAAATGDVTVDYATANGTATAGADYTAASGTLTFAAGETAKTVEVAALADADAEGDETLTLTLSNASGASIGTASATGTVANVVPADTTPPAPSAAEVDGHVATVTFDEDLAPASTDWFNFQWTVSGTGVQHHPDSAWIADKRTVKLRLAQDFPAVAGQTVMLKYEPSDYLRDAAGNRVAFFHMEAENVTLPVLTVADARAEEGTDSTLDFSVRLNAAVEGTVTVDYATSDGTAAAGEDYAATSGTLTFAPGETEKTVSVPIHDDSHDEGSETLSLTLSNAQGARIGDGEATGTIVNSDAIPRGWLARFGRTVAETHVDAVRDRMGASRSPGFSATFAGQPIPGPGAQDGYERATSADGTGFVPGHREGSRSASLASSPEGEILALRALEVPDLESGQARTPDGIPQDGILALRSFLAGDDESEADAEVRALTADDVLLGTSFMMMRDTGTGASRGIWGRASRSGFSGRDGGAAVDGEVTGAMLGTDWKRKGTIFGMVLSQSRGTGTYSGASSGEIDVTLTGLVPWAGREIGRDLSVWGALGIGRGDMTVTPEGTDPIGTGVGWSMAAAGADGTLAAGERLLGAGLRWHADALRTRTSSDAATGLAATSGATTRLRLGVTADWRRTLESGATLGPRLEAGLRHDGGDAETGFGLEIGGGMGFSDPASGLAVTVDGRTLALHEDGAFGSWGLSLGLSWDPRPETKRGWSLSARQSLGGASSGGVDALLGPEAFPGLAGTESDASWSLEAAWGAGRGNGMVGSPYGRASGTGGVDDLRLGWRIEPDAAHAADASLDLWAEPGTGGTGREAGAGLQWRW